MKVNCEDGRTSFYVIYDASLSELLSVGRKFQDWSDYEVFKGYIVTHLRLYFDGGKEEVYVDTSHPSLTKDMHEAIKKKIVDLTKGAKWVVIDEDLQMKIWNLAKYGNDEREVRGLL